jgi:TRAP-type C4-dicarboxylate transport system substrate-binding protein
LTVAVASLPYIIRSKEAAGRAKDQAALPALRATLERLEGG